MNSEDACEAITRIVEALDDKEERVPVLDWVRGHYDAETGRRLGRSPERTAAPEGDSDP